MIVLASSSPRRKHLLEMLGIPFEVDAAHIDEILGEHETPVEFAQRLAAEKARAVRTRRPGDVVLAADTIVVRDGKILGKPTSPADAVAMLEELQGAVHTVVTAVALIAGAGEEMGAYDETRVWFRACSRSVLEEYVATGEPLDKAGAYGIQGYGAVLVERIEGDYFSVMGLPLRIVYDLLERGGVPYHFTR